MSNAYLAQGLRSNTLVAGKTTAIRMITAPWDADTVSEVLISVVRPDGSVLRMTFTSGGWQKVAAGTDKESIVVLIPGKKLGDVGDYDVRAVVLNSVGSVLASYGINASLLATKDLRMMVSRAYPGTGEAEIPGELGAALLAMTRLSYLYPIRDGMSTLNGDMSAGLRFNVDNSPQGPPTQDGNLGPSWDAFQNPPAGQDKLDAALVYRFPRAGDNGQVGASTKPVYNGWLPWSLIVWDPPLAHGFCHETGHNHGLEPPSSPHFDSTGQASHSNEQNVDGSDAADGFDIQLNQVFPTNTLDLMFPTGADPGDPPEQLSLNSFDWEYVRQKLVSRDSTGPGLPLLKWQNLGGHDLVGHPCASRNSGGRLEIFVLGLDGKLYHIWENHPGQDWHGWGTLEGYDLRGPIRTALNRDGRMWVFVLGGDKKIYARVQSATQLGTWDAWVLLGGNQVEDFAVAANQNGWLEIVAVCEDGALYDTTQLPQTDSFIGWQSLGGHDLQARVQLGRNARGNLQVFVLGGNGNIYSRFQVEPNGATGWADWTPLLDPNLVALEDFVVQSGCDGRLFVVLMTKQKSISYIAQTGPDRDWGMTVDLFGHDLKWPCGIGRADDGRLEIAVIGGDGQLYSRWQVDPSQPDTWRNWTPLGGSEIRPGVSLICNSAGEVEVYVIGGNGSLYRGPRSNV